MRPARDAGPQVVHVSAPVLADAKIRVAQARREVLLPTLDLPGDVASDPDRTARVSSPVAGRIEQVSFKEGSVVKRGELLAVVRIPELGRLRSAHAAAVVKSKAARTNADRTRALRAQGLAGEQEAINAAAEADALEAEAHALGQQLTALGTGPRADTAALALRAPIAGTVVSRQAVVGQPVSQDQTIATIADLAEVWFLARAYEHDLPAIHLGDRAVVTLSATGGERFEGAITFVSKQADPLTRAVTVRIPLANPRETLRLGLTGTAKVHVAGADAGARPASIVIERSSVTDLGGRRVVFVKTGPEDFGVRDVRLGAETLDLVEVAEGLREGEEIATDGVFTLKSLALKATFAGEE